MGNMTAAELTELNEKLTALRESPAEFFKAMGLEVTDSELYIYNKFLERDRITISDDLPRHESRRAFFKLVLFNFLTNPKGTTMCIASDRMAYDLRTFFIHFLDGIESSDEFSAIANLTQVKRNEVVFQAVDGRRIYFRQAIDAFGLVGMGENTLYVCYKPHRKLTDVEYNLLASMACYKSDKVITFQAGYNE